MKQVRMAILMAAILVTFSVGALAQDTVLGKGTLQPAQTTGAPAGQSPGEQGINTVKQVYTPPTATTPQPTPAPSVNPLPAKKAAPPKWWQTREGAEEAARRVLSSDHRPKHGLRKLRGMTGRPGKDHVPGHGNALSILHGQDPKHRHWNVVSGTYVDARDQVVLEKANEFTKGFREGLKPATLSQPHDWSWLWLWWPLGIVLGLLLLNWLLNRLHNYWYWDRLTGWFKPKQKQESEPEPPVNPDITNTAGGEHFGTPLKSAKVAGYNDGQSGIVIRKGVCNLHRGNAWKWAEPNQEVSFDYFAGEDVECVVQIQNIRRADIPAAGVMIKDIPIGAPVKAGSGQIWIGSENKICQIPDSLLFELVSGESVEAQKFIDFLPVGKAVNLIYKLDTRPNDYRENELTPAPGGQPQVPIEPLVKLTTVSKPATVAEPEIKPEPKTEPQVVPAEPESATKPEETKAEVIDRLRKEILRGDYKLPEEFQEYLEALPNEDEIRQRIAQYYHTCGILLRIDKDAGKRSYRPKVNKLASEVAMGKAKLDEVEREYRGTTPVEETVADTGTTDDAVTSLTEGLEENEDES